MSRDCIVIDNRIIGAEHPPYIIAELSANHNGSLERALIIMEEAKKAGADAVKLQTYTADTMTIDHDSDEFLIQDGLWQGYTLYKLYQEAHTPWEWHSELFKKGKELDLTVFSSPFDFSAVDFLEELQVPAYKIASFELVDLPLIRKVASTGKPMIMSTGMANLEEIEAAVSVAYDQGLKELILLHCVSGYPTPAEEANLNRIVDLQRRFSIPVGLSDHTMGTTVAVAATALGAVAIEKHFTLSRQDGGHDSAFSLEPDELKKLCVETQISWSSLGTANYEHKESEKGNVIFRRSLYVIEDIQKGEVFSERNVRSIRPGYGLAPQYLSDVLGQKANCDLKRGNPLTWEMLS